MKRTLWLMGALLLAGPALCAQPAEKMLSHPALRPRRPEGVKMTRGSAAMSVSPLSVSRLRPPGVG